MVAKGQFREDLMYRIKVIEIEVPALRNRPDDIEPLVAHFTDVFNKKQQTKKHFQRRTLETLRRYPWPGNIRELQSVVEKHLVVSPNTMIRPEDFDLKLYQTTTTALRGMSLSKFRQLQSEDELRFLTDTIEQAGGNKAEAARRLDIKPNHLQHLLGGTKTMKTENQNPMAQL
jgi:DNA-binding NtrC family response regulator